MQKQGTEFLNALGKICIQQSVFYGLLYFLKGMKKLKKIRSYTNIWSVEKVIYAINDFKLPFPVTFNQMAWFVISLFLVILFGELPPLNLIDGALLKYVGIPVAITFFMNKKTFDGKKPVGFLKSVCTYFLRPKVTYAGKLVKPKKQTLDTIITTVRSEIHVPD